MKNSINFMCEINATNTSKCTIISYSIILYHKNDNSQ